jgi:YcaO-like protein with predicted kinase domain
VSDWQHALAEAFGASVDESDTSRGPTDSLRSRSPAAVLPQLQLAGNVLRISRLIDLTPLDTVGMCVFSAVVPNAVTDCYTNGKGSDRDSALVGALMEAYELHAISQPIAPRVLHAKTLSEVQAAGSAIDPSSLPLPVAQSFAPEVRFDWIPALELGTCTEHYLPADLFSFAYGNGPISRSAGSYATSGGKAVGSSVFDALLHALLELVERDAFIIGQYDPQRSLDVSELEHEAGTAALLGRLRALGLEVYLFELTTELGIPVVKVCLAEPSGFGRVHIHKGIAAHVDRPFAAHRALLEACQVRLTYFVGSRDDVGRGPAPDSALEALREHHRSAPRAAAARALCGRGQLIDAIEGVRSALARVGCERVYVANLSDPRVGLPALACYIPHLEGIYLGEHGWRLNRRGEAARARCAARGGTALAY